MFDNQSASNWQLVVDHSATGRQTVGDRSANSRRHIEDYNFGWKLVADSCWWLSAATGRRLVVAIVWLWLNLCPNMNHFDAVDFSECHFEEVISFFWRSVYMHRPRRHMLNLYNFWLGQTLYTVKTYHKWCNNLPRTWGNLLHVLKVCLYYVISLKC